MKTSVFLLLLSAALAGIAEAATAVNAVAPEPAVRDESVRLPARTAPAEQAEIFSRATGVVGERRVDIGDRVKAGDILAVIEAPEVGRSLERARAELVRSVSRADLARSVLERARNMSQSRVISAEVLDERVSAAQTAEAELDAAKAELARVEVLQGQLTIRAPFDGIIARRGIDRGDHIEGDKSQAGRGLFTLVRLDELRVELDAPPAAALRLKPGQKAAVEFPEMPGERFEAQVARSSGIIDRQLGTMLVELTMPNPAARIPSGLTGTAEVTTGAAQQTWQVPANTLVVREGRNYVAVVRDGKVAFIPVKVGRNFGAKLEIVSGLSAEDRLIVSPNALLREGDAVEVK
jgi:RND family efflux transporter MFP subunit